MQTSQKPPSLHAADGDSLIPALTGGSMLRKEDYLYFEFFNNDFTAGYTDFRNHACNPQQQMQAIRIGDYMGVRTAISSSSDNFKIYNAVTDPAQGINLATSRPDLQARMKYLGLAARRKGAGITRPYDTAYIPAVTPGPVTNGLKYQSYEGYWPWLPEFRDLARRRRDSPRHINLAAPLQGQRRRTFIHRIYLGSHCGSLYILDQFQRGTSLWIHDGHVIDNDFNFTANKTSDPSFWRPGCIRSGSITAIRAEPPRWNLNYSGPGIFHCKPCRHSAFFTEGPTPVFTLQPDTVLTKTGNSGSHRRAGQRYLQLSTLASCGRQHQVPAPRRSARARSSTLPPTAFSAR